MVGIIMVLGVACRNAPNEARVLQVYDTANEMLLRGADREARSYIDSCYRKEHFQGLFPQLRKNMFLIKYFYQGTEPRKGTPFAFENIRLIERSRLQNTYPVEYANALDAIGTYYYFLNEDLDKAFDYYLKADGVRSETEDTCSSRNFKYLGLICYRQEKYRRAMGYFFRALQSETACGAENMYTVFGRQELMDNIALCYTRLRAHDTALEYYKKALDIISDNEDRYPWSRWNKAKGVIYGNLAKAFAAAGKIDTAESLLESSIAINSTPDGERIDAQYSMIQLAELKWLHGKLAPDLLRAIKTSTDTLPNPEVSMRWNKLMYQMLERRGQYKEANLHIRDYYADSIAWSDRTKKVDVAQLLKYQSAQSKITLLQKENELRTSYLWLAAGFSFFVVVIIVVVLVSYRRSRKNLRYINEQNQRLETARTALERSNSEKDRILNVVAHDLRNPVGLIAHLSDSILQDEETSLPPERMLTMINNASRQSMTLINELLGVRDNPALGTMKPVDVAELAAESAEALKFRLEEKKQSITLSFPETRVIVQAEREKLARVFGNLLTNAVKFSKKGGVILLRIEKKERSVLISVEDQGIGIPEELQKHVFDLFSVSRRAGTANEKSYGIGLSVCKQIVEAHGGTISVKSQEGKGTSFQIELPTEQASGALLP